MHSTSLFPTRDDPKSHHLVHPAGPLLPPGSSRCLIPQPHVEGTRCCLPPSAQRVAILGQYSSLVALFCLPAL